MAKEIPLEFVNRFLRINMYVFLQSWSLCVLAFVLCQTNRHGQVRKMYETCLLIPTAGWQDGKQFPVGASGFADSSRLRSDPDASLACLSDSRAHSASRSKPSTQRAAAHHRTSRVLQTKKQQQQTDRLTDRRCSPPMRWRRRRSRSLPSSSASLPSLPPSSPSTL